MGLALHRGARASQRFRDSVDAEICIREEAQAANVFVGPSQTGILGSHL